MSGGDAADFKETDNCSRATGGFAPGGSCTITVTFTPSYSNFESAKIVITDTANNSPQTVYLSGTGTVEQMGKQELTERPFTQRSELVRDAIIGAEQGIELEIQRT